MAYILEESKKTLREVSVKTLVFSFAIIATAFFLKTEDKEYTILISALVLCLFVAVAMFRSEPNSLLRIMNPNRYAKQKKRKDTIIKDLSLLNDEFFIFHTCKIEFFTVEILLVSKDISLNIAILHDKKIKNITQNSFTYGHLSEIRKKLWKTCHFIALLSKKYFQSEFLPTPVLVIANDTKTECNKFDGILIIRQKDMLEAIKRHTQSTIIPDGLAPFLKKRYAHERKWIVTHENITL